MVDLYNRVEPRSIVGTGMASDPDKIEEIEAEAARRERASKSGPKKGFGEVLAEPTKELGPKSQETKAAPPKRRFDRLSFDYGRLVRQELKQKLTKGESEIKASVLPIRVG